MLIAGSYPSRSAAELARTALEAAGISSQIVVDDAGAAYPFDLTGGAVLLVEERDADDARSVLEGRPATPNEQS